MSVIATLPDLKVTTGSAIVSLETTVSVMISPAVAQGPSVFALSDAIPTVVRVGKTFSFNVAVLLDWDVAAALSAAS